MTTADPRACGRSLGTVLLKAVDGGRSVRASAPTSVPGRALLGYGAAVELPPEPAQHEIGNRTYIVANVEPLDVDGIRTVQVGLAIWFLTFLGLLPFWSALGDADRTWWLWTCLAGSGLGLFGLEYCRRRKAARAAGHPHRH